MTYRAVDVMGFAGGFTLGMVQAGFQLVGKREMSGGFGVPNCLANRHLLGHDWQVQATDPAAWTVVPDTTVVFGNPPCSGFSVMSSKEFRGADSKINHCMWSFADYVIRARPTVAVFESVQQAFTKPDGLDLMRRLRAHVEEGTGDRWTLYHVRHNAYSVGGPAQRRRYFWLISRVPFGVEVPQPRMLPTLNDVIGDLAPLGMSWHPQPYRGPVHPYAERLRSTTGVVDGHITRRDSPLWRRMHDLIRGVEWRPGEAISPVARRYYDEFGRLPESFAATEEKIVKNDFNMGFTTPSRWDGDRHAFVITGASLHIVIHPTLDRTITHREAARILGFPDDWRILPLRGQSGLEQTWGKGITVDCGRWIGSWIHRALDGEPGGHVGTPLGDREFDIDVTHAWRAGLTGPMNGAAVRRTHSRDILSPGRRDRVLPVAGRGRVTVTDPNPKGIHHMIESAEAAVAVAEPTAETPAADGASRPRLGRPRPETTLARDEAVYEKVTGKMTKNDIVVATELKPNEVYLSLYRLRSAGRVVRTHEGGNHVWSRTEAPADDAAVANQ